MLLAGGGHVRKDKLILFLILSRPIITAVIFAFGALGLLLSGDFLGVATVVSGGNIEKWAEILAELQKFALLGL